MTDVSKVESEKSNNSASTVAEDTVWDQIRKDAHSTSTAISLIQDRFDKIDANKNGYLTFAELDAEVKTYGARDSVPKGMMIIARDRIEHIQQMSDDEWFKDNGGITKADLAKWQKEASLNLGVEDNAMYAVSILRDFSATNGRAATEHFVDFLMKLPPEERRAAVDRLTQLNVRDRNQNPYASRLYLTFGDVDGDGKRDEITDAKIHEPFGCQCGRPGCNREREIDAYDP